MSEQPTLISSDATTEQLDSILPKLNQLAAELEAENPEIEYYLKLINMELLQYPDLVHLLTDEQIKPIYSALREKSQVQISVKASKKQGKSAGKLSDGSALGDLL